MKLIHSWQKLSLVLRIAIGLVIGLVLALIVPSWQWISILGDLFVGALRAIAPILVFFIVTSSLSQGSTSSAGVLKTIIFLYLISTLIAAIVAVIGSFLFPIKLTLTTASEAAAPSGIYEILQNMLINIVANPVSALVDANYIGILFWAVLTGIALRKGSETTKKVMNDLSNAITNVVSWIIQCAPFGILGLVFQSVSSGGLSIFAEYGELLLVLIGCILIIYFITNPILVFLCIHQNPFPLIFFALRRSAVTAFFTRSSAANIPVNMELCQELGLNKDVYSVSIPLGSTINMDGAAITITVMTLAAVYTSGIQVDIPSAILLSLVATLSACGASGVAGGSLLLIPMACSLFNIPNEVAMQVVGIGFIISVIQDSMETALNSSADFIMTAAAEFHEWKKQGRKLPL